MRLPRVRFVVKLGIFVIILLLLGPYLFHLKLSEDSADEAEEYRKWQQRHKDEQKNKLNDLEDLHSEDTPKMIARKSETAVLKKNVFGNFEPPDLPTKEGPGENGKPVHLSSEEKYQAEQSVTEFGFNMVASDKVAMDRSIPDTRPEECKHWHYSTKQPKASVVLVFHNEGFSTLVRTIHSVVRTSPRQFLEEVVLVDDFSTKEHLKKKLEDYVEKEFKGLVKIYRNSKREGLIRTRTRGAEVSTGDVVVFLDAHCECNKNWLVPLLDRIRQNRTTLAVPIVDGIDWNTMEYAPVYGRVLHRGIFEWGFFYKETAVPAKELMKRQYNSEPYWSPTHAGGLFAIDRKYFFELGGYDPGLKIWGGENYELSFKIWQCGGSVEWVPCSHVGHIYRNHMPYGLGKDVDPFMSPIYINYMRVVEVWMEDEFKEYFYTREPSFRGYPYGDISKQLAFKQEHNCKSFKWFMDNIAYDVYDQYPKPPPNKAWGEIRKKGTNDCWDAGSMNVDSSHVSLSVCHGIGHSQMFRLNVKGQIGIGERCILAQNSGKLFLTYCNTQPTGPWEWDEKTGVMRHTELDKCVSVDESNNVYLDKCSGNPSWDIKEIYPWKRSRRL
ncbi:N-acetylgalactosaminyltransferase 7-like [Physella acuta]|uniref:N-acetylgalactosaminyltransferase 7-like n=1 Tax=Physella acuta TaxID=109671 RepID=UPI0027DD64A3|nr:N-acetylgalactosaminyltransferase 7-like [Physella acuta]